MNRPPIFFQVGSRLLQVAAAKEPSGWAVRIFDGKGKQVSPIVYSVDYETQFDASMGPLPVD